MKRSKIFLGVTTCLLAMAGVAAANHFRSSITRWYITEGDRTGLQHCVRTGTIMCTYHINKTPTCLYHNLAVFTSGSTGFWFNCRNKLVYTRLD